MTEKTVTPSTSGSQGRSKDIDWPGHQGERQAKPPHMAEKLKDSRATKTGLQGCPLSPPAPIETRKEAEPEAITLESLGGSTIERDGHIRDTMALQVIFSLT